MKMGLFHIEHCSHHAMIYLGRKQLFRLPERVCFDRLLCEENRRLAAQQLSLHRNGILSSGNGAVLLATNNLQKIGGVERRLAALCQAVKNSGHQVYILTEPGCRHLDLPDAYPLELNFNASNFGELLLQFIRHFDIKVVEFQCKNVSFLRYLDLKQLKQHAVCGCTIHFCGKLPFGKIRELDYRIFVSERMKLWYRQKLDPALPGEIFYNGVATLPESWHFNGQRRALYISRIGNASVPKIRQFIEYCQAHGLDFHIAGDGRDQKIVQDIRKMLSSQYHFPETFFTGAVETLSFLAEHAGEYLFAAGVGQVALECAAAGMPVLILSDHSLEDATFITPENYEFFRKRNFTINRQPDAVRSLALPEDSCCSMRQEILRDRSIENIAAGYTAFIEKFL